MRLNRHLDLDGRHSYLSPSKPSWSNYDDEKFDKAYMLHLAAMDGTAKHKLAHDLIKHKQHLPETEQTLNRYVNDAINFRMSPEQPLFYSDNCFGTADALSFRDNLLRIHDLKTGITPASIRQLEVYAALFCLEYKFKPFEINIELRIYQSDQVNIYEADPDVIFYLTDKIVAFDNRILKIREEVFQ